MLFASGQYNNNPFSAAAASAAAYFRPNPTQQSGLPDFAGSGGVELYDTPLTAASHSPFARELDRILQSGGPDADSRAAVEASTDRRPAQNEIDDRRIGTAVDTAGAGATASTREASANGAAADGAPGGADSGKPDGAKGSAGSEKADRTAEASTAEGKKRRCCPEEAKRRCRRRGIGCTQKKPLCQSKSRRLI